MCNSTVKRRGRIKILASKSKRSTTAQHQTSWYFETKMTQQCLQQHRIHNSGRLVYEMFVYLQESITRYLRIHIGQRLLTLHYSISERPIPHPGMRYELHNARCFFAAMLCEIVDNQLLLIIGFNLAQRNYQCGHMFYSKLF